MRPEDRHSLVRAALWCGVAGPVLFLAVAVFGGMAHPGYSHMSQAISELTMAGAPNKATLDAGLVVFEALNLAFAIGYFLSVRKDGRLLPLSAACLGAIGLMGLFFPWFPMDPMGAEMTPEGRGHLVIVSVSALAALSAVVLAWRGWRRVPGGGVMSRLSLIALALMLLGGVMSLATGVVGLPGIGLWQRVNTAAFEIWHLLLAVTLLRGALG